MVPVKSSFAVRTTPEAVFRALLLPEALRKWWVLFPNTALKFAAHAGESHAMAREDATGDWLLSGRVIACDPPRYLACTWNSPWTATDMLVEWWVEDMGDNSVRIHFHLRHGGWTEGAAISPAPAAACLPEGICRPFSFTNSQGFEDTYKRVFRE